MSKSCSGWEAITRVSCVRVATKEKKKFEKIYYFSSSVSVSEHEAVGLWENNSACRNDPT